MFSSLLPILGLVGAVAVYGVVFASKIDNLRGDGEQRGNRLSE
ncbi:hypothetical protein BH11PSE9_BH11PSE9_12070 [soil metagenome]